MNDDQERFLRQAARMNRERLAAVHREVVMQEEAKKAVDVRRNMAHLRELRLTREAQEVRMETSKANPHARPTRKKRFR
jgi:hypothetical protein